MKPLSALENHMFRDMITVSNKLIENLLIENKDTTSIVLIERIANIFISRLRKFLRMMDEMEVYELTKQLPSLKKMRASEKKILASKIKEFLKYV